MAKARAIIKRRKAVRNIAKITKTMNMIATARFKKAFDRAVAARPFTDRLNALLADLAGSNIEYNHPLMTVRANPKRTTILVITSNRGLCGGYNANILREAVETLAAETAAGREITLDVAGKRGASYFRFTGQPARNVYTTFEDKPRYEQVEPIANGLMNAYIEGQTDRVLMVYMKFYTAGRQTPTTVQLLPFEPVFSEPRPSGTGTSATGTSATGTSATGTSATGTSATGTSATGTSATGTSSLRLRTNYLLLPDAAGLLDELIPQALKVSLFQGFLDAAVSEQVARMVAMKAATDNARDLAKNLTMLYNRARQTQITTELSEIISGASAISG